MSPFCGPSATFKDMRFVPLLRDKRTSGAPKSGHLEHPNSARDLFSDDPPGLLKDHLVGHTIRPENVKSKRRHVRLHDLFTVCFNAGTEITIPRTLSGLTSDHIARIIGTGAGYGLARSSADNG